LRGRFRCSQRIHHAYRPGAQPGPADRRPCLERVSIDKLVRAGADEVVSPYGLTGRRMAVLAVQPTVLEVLDLLNLGSDIRLEEVAVRAGTHLDGLTIAEARAHYAGVTILALKKPGSGVAANPDDKVRLAPGDLIVALGPAETLSRMVD
jgi:voltage-gated potassium channel